MAESIDHEGIYTFKVLVFLFRYGLHVGDVEEIPDAEAHDRECTVKDTDGENFDSRDVDRFVGSHREEIDGRHARIALFLGCEAVRDALEEMVGTELFGIDIDIAEDAVWTKVIESAHMVIVFVGDEYGIEAAEVSGEHLLTEVRSAVDEYATTINIDKSGATQTFVAWIGAGACGAVAAYLWHSA